MKEDSLTVLRSAHCDVANIVIISHGHKRDPHTEGALFVHRIQYVFFVCHICLLYVSAFIHVACVIIFHVII